MTTNHENDNFWIDVRLFLVMNSYAVARPFFCNPTQHFGVLGLVFSRMLSARLSGPVFFCDVLISLQTLVF